MSRPSREYPERPIVGVGGIVLEGSRVVLVRRGAEPLRGQWSIPGGAVEVGEPLAEALVREGMPFREAHERLAASVRNGSYEAAGDAAASVAARDGIGPGGVRAALAEARRRFGDNL